MGPYTLNYLSAIHIQCFMRLHEEMCMSNPGQAGSAAEAAGGVAAGQHQLVAQELERAEAQVPREEGAGPGSG